jgi:hypothetical protein
MQGATRGSRLYRPLVLAMLLALISGCGQPSFTYVKNSGQKTYFKVPSSWNQIDRASIDRLITPDNPDSATAALRRKLVWSVGYDADKNPSAMHMLEATGNSPFVYVSVSTLGASQRDDMSLNALRDLLLPVSAGARQAAAATTFPLTGFELLADDVVTPTKGIHGIHAVYNYAFPDGQEQTYDQTAYVSDDVSRVYLMLIVCSASCHRDRASEIKRVATSFTVRSQ